MLGSKLNTGNGQDRPRSGGAERQAAFVIAGSEPPSHEAGMTILLALLAAAASPAPGPGQVSIPFVNHRRAIRTFEAVGDDILYLQDRRSRWYRAELGGACFGLRWANAIGYDNRGRLTLGRGDSILVEGQRCLILSLTPSDPPPRRRKAKKG